MELTVLLPEREVYVNGHKLDPRKSQKRVNHSPDGFMWGYEGSGPAQLALAVMMQMLEGSPDKDRINDYQKFKRDVIAKIPMDKSVAVEMDFVGWLNGEKDYRFEMKELDSETPKNKIGKSMGHCTLGHADRCFKGSGKQCECQCGGQNHGKWYSIN